MFRGLILGLLALQVHTHPGIGIVQDRRGQVYYTDLRQVWRIASDGSRSVAVPNVHTHELAMEGEALVGEHLWYEGDRAGRWGHRIWRLTADGREETVRPPAEGFLRDYSFVRDGAGNQYWLDRERGWIRKRTPDGRILEHARWKFRDGRWLTATANGALFFVDATDLVEVDPAGAARLLVKDLQSRRPNRASQDDRHALMGLWTDPAGNVYVAGHLDREVKRVDQHGRVTVAARSAPGWGPTGGLVAADGALWILECSVTNAVQVRRLGADGSERRWP